MRDLLAEFHLRDWIQPGGYYGALVYGVLFFGIAYALGRAVRIGVKRLLEKDKRRLVDRTTVSFLAQLAQIGIYIFSFVSYAHLVPALQRLGTAWLASVGVASVVFGMAAQNTLGNLIAGFSLLLYQPFKLGDRLQIIAPTGLETGTVESLNWGYTVLKTPDNRRVVVPNSVMANQTTVNLSMVEERMIFTFTVRIGYRADLDKARGILLQLAKEHPKAQEVTGCTVSELGNAGVQLSLGMWCANSDAAAVLKTDLLESVKKRFEAEGIEIPYPYSNVILIAPSSTGSGKG